MRDHVEVALAEFCLGEVEENILFPAKMTTKGLPETADRIAARSSLTRVAHGCHEGFEIEVLCLGANYGLVLRRDDPNQARKKTFALRAEERQEARPPEVQQVRVEPGKRIVSADELALDAMNEGERLQMPLGEDQQPAIALHRPILRLRSERDQRSPRRTRATLGGFMEVARP